MSKKQVKPAKAKRVKVEIEIEMVLWIPQDTAGEVGEPLHPTIIEHINRLVPSGWWPLSFGEDGSENMPAHVELWFAWDPAIAAAQAKFFIDQNGVD